MMRGMIGTVLWACLAGAVGVGLFFIKHEVKEQEARLSALNLEIQRNQEAIHVLRAEWSYLNDPARLRALAEKHLAMKPVAPTQMASLSQIDRGALAIMVAADHKPGKTATAQSTAPQPAPAPAASAPAAKPVPATRPTGGRALAQAEPAKPAPSAVPVPAPAAATVRPLAVARVEHSAAAMAVPAQPASSRAIVIRSPALAANDMLQSGEAR